MSSFGERLKKLRRHVGMTQADVAAKLGKSTSAVRMWELGANEPDIHTLVALSAIFDSSLDYLLCRDLALGGEGAIRTRLPVYPLSAYAPETEPAYYKSIPSDYLDAGGSFLMIENDSDELSPLVPRGAVVLIRRQDACFEGQICLVRCEGRCSLRKINYLNGAVVFSGAPETSVPLVFDASSGAFEICGIATEYSKTL